MVKIEYATKGYKNRKKFHVLSDRCLIWCINYISQHISKAFLYVPPLLTYTQLPYLIQIMHVLTTVSSTSVCACL